MIYRRSNLWKVATLLVVGISASWTAAETDLPETIGPYLQHPGTDRMTVCFLTRHAEYVEAHYQPTVGGQRRRVQPAAQAIDGTPWTVWKAALTNLEPDTAYAYELVYRTSDRQGQTPSLRFRTLSEESETVKAAFFNDLHSRPDTLKALMEHVEPEDFEFSVLMGDCWQDPSSANGAEAVFAVLNDYIRLLKAGEKPMLYIRGNHEVRGTFAASMAFLFDLPMLDPTAALGEQAHQFALTAGPIRLIALDTGEDFDKRADLFEPMRRRQAGWLKRIGSTDHAATWQILATHQPLYNNNIWYSEASRVLWEPMLTETEIDIALAGHDHRWKHLPAGERFEVTLSREDAKRHIGTAGVFSLHVPWPILIGGGPAVDEATVMLLSADKKTLQIRLLAAADGKTLTEITLNK